MRRERAAPSRRDIGKFDGEDPGAIRVRRRPRHPRRQAGTRTVEGIATVAAEVT